MNNTELIKLIALYVNMKHDLPKVIKGYEKSIVLDAINNMISKKVIFEGEMKQAPWEVDPNNQTKQYRRTAFYIDKELLKAEYGNEETKIK